MHIYEKKIIGGILAGKILPSTVDLDPADMPELGDALNACLRIEAEGKAVTPDLLATRLAASDCFYSHADFDLMARAAPSASVVFDAVDKVKAAGLQTFLRSKIADLAADDRATGSQLLDAIKQAAADADRKYRTSENNFVFLNEITPKLEAVYRDLHAGVSYAVPTGFPALDAELIDGFTKGDLHGIVAMTGQGKSALALNCARMQAETGLVVGVVSREMSAVENAMRLQSSRHSVPRWQMKREMYDATFDRLTEGLPDLQQLPIAFDTRTADVESLRLQAQRMVEQYQMGILYVDYLQLMKASDKATRAEEVSAVSRGLKEIAMENNIPVIALLQFNRGAGNASVFDLLSHVKESSGIEQDVSTMTYIQLEKTEEPKQIREALLYVLKNRNGATFRPVPMFFRGETFSFAESAETFTYRR